MIEAYQTGKKPARRRLKIYYRRDFQYWYDRSSRTWWFAKFDRKGYQVGDADHHFTRQQVEDAIAELIALEAMPTGESTTGESCANCAECSGFDRFGFGRCIADKARKVIATDGSFCNDWKAKEKVASEILIGSNYALILIAHDDDLKIDDCSSYDPEDGSITRNVYYLGSFVGYHHDEEDHRVAADRAKWLRQMNGTVRHCGNVESAPLTVPAINFAKDLLEEGEAHMKATRERSNGRSNNWGGYWMRRGGVDIDASAPVRMIKELFELD